MVDVLLADYAQIDTLVSLKAQIDEITANTIHANTRVSAHHGNFIDISTGSIQSPVYYYKPDSMGAVNIIPNIVAQFRFSVSGNRVTLQGIKLNSSSWTNLASFDIPDSESE